jgi:hypothetical protein
MNDAISYIRVSSEDQADSGLGLEAQRHRIAAGARALVPRNGSAAQFAGLVIPPTRFPWPDATSTNVGDPGLGDGARQRQRRRISERS